MHSRIGFIIKSSKLAKKPVLYQLFHSVSPSKKCFHSRNLAGNKFNSQPKVPRALLFLFDTLEASCHRSYCSYTAEQFSDDEYECDYENNPASSSVANVDEWKWKLTMLLRGEKGEEIVSRDKRDRRDFEQISNLAKRMGLYW